MAAPKKRLRERDDFYLATVAGRDIDVKTLIPPTASTAREELLLEIADRFNRCEGAVLPPYLSLERITNYLYKVSFDKLPDDNEEIDPPITACSSYVANGKLYRNLDWNYADTAEFIVECKRFTGMSFLDGLNDSNMDNEKIKLLPYRVVDGVNENGIMVATHVLFNDWEYAGSGNKNIPLYKIPYLILNNITTLDNFSTAMGQYLNNIKVSDGLIEMEYLLQFMVTDGETTYAILPPESKTGTYSVVDITSTPKLANFRWVNRNLVSRMDEDIQTRPTGIERFNQMPCELKDIKFTNAYESSDYLSEFIGLRGTDKNSTDEELLSIYNSARELYLDRKRDGMLWQTVHSIVYSNNGIESLYIQENYNRDVLAINIPIESIVQSVLNYIPQYNGEVM